MTINVHVLVDELRKHHGKMVAIPIESEEVYQELCREFLMNGFKDACGPAWLHMTSNPRVQEHGGNIMMSFYFDRVSYAPVWGGFCYPEFYIKESSSYVIVDPYECGLIEYDNLQALDLSVLFGTK